MSLKDVLNNEQISKFRFIYDTWNSLNLFFNTGSYDYFNKSSVCTKHFLLYLMSQNIFVPLKLPIDDYSLSPKMKRLLTLYQLIMDSSMSNQNPYWRLNRPEFNILHDLIEVMYYLCHHIRPNLNFSEEKIDFYMKTDINKERIIKRTKIFKEELMQVTWHPDKVQKWLDQGEKIFAMMIGDDEMK